ncbi:MAG: hypothetical protein OJF59_002386 [Cytophagales bacterium]|nr:MAG: hypothetical protein OJF59_002386 [Cytophagales bacterium]
MGLLIHFYQKRKADNRNLNLGILPFSFPSKEFLENLPYLVAPKIKEI